MEGGKEKTKSRQEEEEESSKTSEGSCVLLSEEAAELKWTVSGHDDPEELHRHTSPPPPGDTELHRAITRFLLSLKEAAEGHRRLRLLTQLTQILSEEAICGEAIKIQTLASVRRLGRSNKGFGRLD